MNPKFPAGAQPVKLYRVAKSGHSHRAELMLALLDIPYETVEVDMGNGAHKAPDYLAISPFGQVPAIDDNGTILSDSNGILIYLIGRYGDGHDWLPADPVGAANVQRWLSVAAGEIAYGPCAARLVTVFGAGLDHDNAKAISHNVFKVIDKVLSESDFLAGSAITLADVAGYTYTAHAPEGGDILIACEFDTEIEDFEETQDSQLISLVAKQLDAKLSHRGRRIQIAFDRA